MLTLVPPVASPIVVDTRAAGGDFFRRPGVRLYGSGTAALAAALCWSADHFPGRDEVLLPAYGCPALVAAVRHAGMRAVLLDVARGSPFPALETLRAAVSARTAACIHVNFLGIAPPVEPVPGQPGTRPMQVYDSCQGWPEGSTCPDWADLAVLSFGRGKPVTLGHGGALIANGRLASMLQLPGSPPGRDRGALRFRLHALLFNAALRPAVFWWVDRTPFLDVGATRYRPLAAIDGMWTQACRSLDANIGLYLRRPGWTLALVRELLESHAMPGFQLPAAVSAARPDTRLLRLPLLAQSPQLRDRAVAALRSAGYGATAMYEVPLWAVPGLEFLRSFAPACPNAVDLAGRLLTLPVHQRVSGSMLEDMLRRLGSL